MKCSIFTGEKNVYLRSVVIKLLFMNFILYSFDKMNQNCILIIIIIVIRVIQLHAYTFFLTEKPSLIVLAIYGQHNKLSYT